MLKKRENSHIFIPMGASMPSELFQNQIVCEWLTSTEAARYLGISENALRIMVYRRQVKFQKLGRRLRFNVRDISELLPIKGVRS